MPKIYWVNSNLGTSMYLHSCLKLLVLYRYIYVGKKVFNDYEFMFIEIGSSIVYI